MALASFRAFVPPDGVRTRSIPEATVGRLPVYLRALVEMAEDGRVTVSSEALADAAGVNSAKVRKDLSHLGSYGTRGVGYDVAYLIHQVRRELGLTQHWPVLIAGVGNLITPAVTGWLSATTGSQAYNQLLYGAVLSSGYKIVATRFDQRLKGLGYDFETFTLAVNVLVDNKASIEVAR